MFRLSQIFGSRKSRKRSNQPKQRLFESLEKREMMAVTPLYYALAPIQPATSPQVTVATNFTPHGTLEAVSLSNMPALSSRPGASATLYLDFNGHVQELNNRPDLPLSGFAIDGNHQDWKAEQAAIHEIWARVAEDFSPFNINVTTVDPGDFSHGSMNLRVAITGGDIDPLQNRGGFGAVNAFTLQDKPNVVYVFSISNGQGENDPAGLRSNKTIANLISHEAGHAFGLEHYPKVENGKVVGEYDTGDAKKAPIMGNANGSERGVWSTGINEKGNRQWDLETIASVKNGFGFAPDGKDSFETAGPLQQIGNSLRVSGILHFMDDVDVYRFDTNGGEINVMASIARTEGNVGDRIGNLDAVLELYDSQGRLLQRDAGEQLEPSIITTVPAGSYFVKIGSQGAYGDVGQYTIEVFEFDGPRVLSTNYVNLNSTQGGVWVKFNKAIKASTFTTADIKATGVSVLSVTADANDPTRFLVTITKPTVAFWSLAIGPDIRDLFNNQMDQNRDGGAGDPEDVFHAEFLGTTTPTLDQGSPTTGTLPKRIALTSKLVDAVFAS